MQCSPSAALTANQVHPVIGYISQLLAVSKGCSNISGAAAFHEVELSVCQTPTSSSRSVLRGSCESGRPWEGENERAPWRADRLFVASTGGVATTSLVIRNLRAAVVNDSKPSSPSRSRETTFNEPRRLMPGIASAQIWEHDGNEREAQRKLLPFPFLSFSPAIPGRQIGYHLSAGDTHFVPRSHPSESARGGNAKS